MPTYEYICRACEHEFEAFQSMSESLKRKCPECGKNTLERKIGTGAAVLFKGSGFYQTDYRSESYKKGADSEKKPADGVKSDGAKADGVKPAGEAAKSGAESKPKPAARASESKPAKKSKAE